MPYNHQQPSKFEKVFTLSVTTCDHLQVAWLQVIVSSQPCTQVRRAHMLERTELPGKTDKEQLLLQRSDDIGTSCPRDHVYGSNLIELDRIHWFNAEFLQPPSSILWKTKEVDYTCNWGFTEGILQVLNTYGWLPQSGLLILLGPSKRGANRHENFVSSTSLRGGKWQLGTLYTAISPVWYNTRNPPAIKPENHGWRVASGWCILSTPSAPHSVLLCKAAHNINQHRAVVFILTMPVCTQWIGIA